MSCSKEVCYLLSTVILLTLALMLLIQFNQKEDDLLQVVKKLHFNDDNKCSIEIVESIPYGLKFPNDTVSFKSTFEAWQKLLDLANETSGSLDIGSFYWTLRGVDVIKHQTANEGEEIFNRILSNGEFRNIKIRIAQSIPTEKEPNNDTELFKKYKAADVRSVNFPKLLGGGVLHTKLWIVNNQHFYIGSANMDWRSLTQVKELGILAQNCNNLAEDVSKIFNAYWYLGQNTSVIPPKWPEEYSTIYNKDNPMNVKFNNNFNMLTFFSSSPPALTANGRTNDLEAILNTISSAKYFVNIAVMDYIPVILYSKPYRYWPYIDNYIRTAAIERKISIKLLISWWSHSNPSEDLFLRSLQSLSNVPLGVDIQIRRFVVPTDKEQSTIPFSRVNHNKYMVTDNTAYIGTSNWSGDYFTDTAGIGLILNERNEEVVKTLRNDLLQVFLRDWNSEYSMSSF